MQHEMDDSHRGVESAEAAARPIGGVGTADQPVEGASTMPLTAGLETGEPGTVPKFLDQIARQMLAAVDSERSRISADTANSFDERVRQVRMRAAKESEELRRLAETDVEEINEWSAGEADRIRRETESRIAVRREDLDRHLGQHDLLIEREISGASEAVEQYQTELDQFVDRLANEHDPTDIAQLARELPEPPDIDKVVSAARAEAIAELSRSETAEDVQAASLGLVGVMDRSVIKPRTGLDGGEEASTAASEATDLESAGDAAASPARISPAVWWALVILVIAIVAGLVFLLATGRLTVAGF